MGIFIGTGGGHPPLEDATHGPRTGDVDIPAAEDVHHPGVDTHAHPTESEEGSF